MKISLNAYTPHIIFFKQNQKIKKSENSIAIDNNQHNNYVEKQEISYQLCNFYPVFTSNNSIQQLKNYKNIKTIEEKVDENRRQQEIGFIFIIRKLLDKNLISEKMLKKYFDKSNGDYDINTISDKLTKILSKSHLKRKTETIKQIVASINSGKLSPDEANDFFDTCMLDTKELLYRNRELEEEIIELYDNLTSNMPKDESTYSDFFYQFPEEESERAFSLLNYRRTLKRMNDILQNPTIKKEYKYNEDDFRKLVQISDTDYLTFEVIKEITKDDSLANLNISNLISLTNLPKDIDIDKIISLIRDNEISCIKDFININKNKKTKKLYENFLEKGYSNKISLILANIEQVEQLDEKDIVNIIQALRADEFSNEQFSKILSNFLSTNKKINLKEFSKYISSFDIDKIKKENPILKNYSFSDWLILFNSHFKIKTRKINQKSLTLNKNITEYFEHNYVNRNDLNELYTIFPYTDRKIGKIPNEWLNNIKPKKKEQAPAKIYNIIENFRQNRNIEDFEHNLSRLLNKNVKVTQVGAGYYGICYKIDFNSDVVYCLKLFYDEDDKKDYDNFGVSAEPQIAIYTNKHSKKFVKMFFGNVAPFDNFDGFLVTQFLSSKYKPLPQEKSVPCTRIYNQDIFLKPENKIRGLIVDFGGTVVIK